MRRLLFALAAVMPLAAAPTVRAQELERGPAIEFLLARTGQLQLTDQQVVKLAAIARRAADRHKAMRASFDSLHAQFRRGGDSARRGGGHFGPPPELMTAMQREHEAAHADLRDAIAMLTPDQQARAWELVSERHMLMRHFGPRRDGHGPGLRPGPMHRSADDGPDDGEDEPTEPAE